MIKENKIQRFKLLHLLYSLTGGDTQRRVPIEAGNTATSQEALSASIAYLTAEGLAKSYPGNWLQLTHKGLVVLEDCMTHNREAKHGFIAVAEIDLTI